MYIKTETESLRAFVREYFFGSQTQKEKTFFTFYAINVLSQIYSIQFVECSATFDYIWNLFTLSNRFVQRNFREMPAIPRVDRIKVVYSAAKKLNYAFRMAGFPDAPFNNGVSSYQPQLHRITFRLCKKNSASAGMRNFIDYSLVQFGTENPSCALYVIPAQNVVPTLVAEYSNGRKVHLNAKGMT